VIATLEGECMYIEAGQGTVLMKLGRRFGTPDAERLAQAVESLVPFSQLIVDFTDVRESHDAAFFSLAGVLRALAEVSVVLRGLTIHQSRLLKYLGLPIAELRARA
jgi:hypothetical protein